jgi:hypothetical protein
MKSRAPARVRLPDETMAEPIESVTRFMETRERSYLRGVFLARDATIVENFAPYVFRGPAGLRRWAAGFLEHTRSQRGLRARFGRSQDLTGDGERAFVTLRTTWTGRDGGRPFRETGAWTFVLERRRGRWRIAAYAWGVFAFKYLETAAQESRSVLRRP